MNATNMKDGYIKLENEVEIDDEITFEDIDAYVPRSHIVSEDLCIEEGHEGILDTLKSKTSSSESGYQELIEEQRKAEKNEEEFSCLNCNFIFVTEDDLVSHLESSCKGNGTHSKRESDFVKSSLPKNADKINVERKFKCSWCSFECNQKLYLKLHMLKHQNKKLFKCSECSYECNRKADLKTHLKTHRNTKLFKCSKCSYECNLKRDLKTHLLTHRKLFKCSECNYECNQKGDLKTHLQTHTNTFKCPLCSYECNRKADLKTHLLTHGNTNLFKCSECNYEFKRKSNLQRHIQRHTKTKLFKCSECNYDCNQKKILQKHLLTHGNIGNTIQLD